MLLTQLLLFLVRPYNLINWSSTLSKLVSPSSLRHPSSSRSSFGSSFSCCYAGSQLDHPARRMASILKAPLDLIAQFLHCKVTAIASCSQFRKTTQESLCGFSPAFLWQLASHFCHQWHFEASFHKGSQTCCTLCFSSTIAVLPLSFSSVLLLVIFAIPSSRPLPFSMSLYTIWLLAPPRHHPHLWTQSPGVRFLVHMPLLDAQGLPCRRV